MCQQDQQLSYHRLHQAFSRTHNSISRISKTMILNLRHFQPSSASPALSSQQQQQQQNPSTLVECSEHAAYDQFLQYANEKWWPLHMSWTQQHTSGDADAELMNSDDAQCLHSVSNELLKSVSAVLLSIDHQTDTTSDERSFISTHVYMTKCCLLLLGLYMQSEPLFIQLTNACHHPYSHNDDNDHSEQSHDSNNHHTSLLLSRFLNETLFGLANVSKHHQSTSTTTHHHHFSNDQDELLVRIGSIHALSLMTNHYSCLHWLTVQKQVISNIVLSALCHNNWYVRSAGANLLVRLIYLNSIFPLNEQHQKHQTMNSGDNTSVEQQGELERRRIIDRTMIHEQLIEPLLKYCSSASDDTTNDGEMKCGQSSRSQSAEFFDFLLTLLQHAFGVAKKRDDDLLHVQLNRLSVMGSGDIDDDSKQVEHDNSISTVIQHFITEHELMQHVRASMMNPTNIQGSHDSHHHEELSKMGDILIYLSKSRKVNLHTNETNNTSTNNNEESALLLLGSDYHELVTIFLRTLLTTDEYTIDLACRIISSLDASFWKVNSYSMMVSGEQSRNSSLIELLFENVQVLLQISVIPITMHTDQRTQFVHDLQALNARKKLKLINLLLQSLCDLITTMSSTIGVTSGVIFSSQHLTRAKVFQLLMAILQEYEPLHASVSVMVYRLLIAYLNSTTDLDAPSIIMDTPTMNNNAEHGTTHMKQMKEYMFNRFKTSNHATSFTLIGQCLPLIGDRERWEQQQRSEDCDRYCNILTERLFDFSWEIRDSCLCVIDHLIQAYVVVVQQQDAHTVTTRATTKAAIPMRDMIVHRLLGSKFHNQHVRDIAINKLTDSQQFVRLSAINLLRTLLSNEQLLLQFTHNNSNDDENNQHVAMMDAFTTCAKIIADSEFSIRKSIFKSLEHCCRDCILPLLSPQFITVHESFIEYMRRGIDKIVNEFDFESMYYVLGLTNQLCASFLVEQGQQQQQPLEQRNMSGDASCCSLPSPASASHLIQFIMVTNMYDVLYECISNCSVDRTQKLAVSITETLMSICPTGQHLQQIPATYREKYHRLTSECTTIVAEAVREAQHQGTASNHHDTVDIIDFFQFEQESYDCY